MITKGMGKGNERKKVNGGALSKSYALSWRATSRPYSLYVKTKSGVGGRLLAYGAFGLIYDSRERLYRKFEFQLARLLGKLV
jgi:hypothetical protein